MLLHVNIDQILLNSLCGQLNCETGGLDYRIITTENVLIVYTCNTYSAMHWSMYFFQECPVDILMQYLYSKTPL